MEAKRSAPLILAAVVVMATACEQAPVTTEPTGSRPTTPTTPAAPATPAAPNPDPTAPADREPVCERWLIDSPANGAGADGAVIDDRFWWGREERGAATCEAAMPASDERLHAAGGDHRQESIADGEATRATTLTIVEDGRLLRRWTILHFVDGTHCTARTHGYGRSDCAATVTKASSSFTVQDLPASPPEPPQNTPDPPSNPPPSPPADEDRFPLAPAGSSYTCANMRMVTTTQISPWGWLFYHGMLHIYAMIDGTITPMTSLPNSLDDSIPVECRMTEDGDLLATLSGGQPGGHRIALSMLRRLPSGWTLPPLTPHCTVFPRHFSCVPDDTGSPSLGDATIADRTIMPRWTFTVTVVEP